MEVENLSMWVWILIGLASFFCLSLLVGFGLAAILETIGHQISEVHETDDWAMLLPTRASNDVEEQHTDELGVKSSCVVRLR